MAAAEQAAVEARAQLDALDDQVREIARSAYTADGLTHLDLLLSSESAEHFVSRLGTLEMIAGHTSDVLVEVATAADRAQARAAEAVAEAKRAVDEIAAKQAGLEVWIADYQAQFEALTAAQQEQVVTAHAGEAVAPAAVQGTVAALSSAAPGPAAQVAVQTALGQVGDPVAFDSMGGFTHARRVAG